MNLFPLALGMSKWAFQQMGLLDWLLPLRLNAHLLSRLETYDEVRCLLLIDHFLVILLTLFYFCGILYLHQFESYRILVFLRVLLQRLVSNGSPFVLWSGHLSLMWEDVWHADQNSAFVFLVWASITLCGSRTSGCNCALVVGMIDLNPRLISSCAVEPMSSIGVFLYSSSPK